MATCGDCLHWLDPSEVHDQCALLSRPRCFTDDASLCPRFIGLKPRRCFDDRCQVREDCPLYARRHDRQQGAGASTWRHGWEYPGGPCAVAMAERGAGCGEPQTSNTNEEGP